MFIVMEEDMMRSIRRGDYFRCAKNFMSSFLAHEVFGDYQQLTIDAMKYLLSLFCYKLVLTNPTTSMERMKQSRLEILRLLKI